MTKTVIIVSIFALIASSCGNATKKQPEATDNETVVEQKTNNATIKEETIFDSDESENSIEDTTEIPILKNTNNITIDPSYFQQTKEGTKRIYHYDSEYGKYGITELDAFLTPGEHYYHDNMNVSFSIIAEVTLYDNIQSLIIRGDTEHALGIWLVNYDKTDIVDGDFYRYIDSYIVGQDEWAESASSTTSVIHIQPKPYIEKEERSWGKQKNSTIEILKSGKFKLTDTVHSTYKM
jgi:hypothetical protein